MRCLTGFLAGWLELRPLLKTACLIGVASPVVVPLCDFCLEGKGLWLLGWLLPACKNFGCVFVFVRRLPLYFLA